MIMNQKLWIQYPQYGHQMLKPLGELPSFRYLNEIGAKNDHFNFATLSDKQSQKVYETNSLNRQVFIMQTLQTCKKTYNFKHTQENNYTSNSTYKRCGRKK